MQTYLKDLSLPTTEKIFFNISMINIDKQINYRLSGSSNDIETAELLLNNKKSCMVCFFVICQ